MGTKPNPLVSVVKSNIECISQFCDCHYATMTSEEAGNSFNANVEIRYQLHEMMLRFIDIRGPRRTPWQKVKCRIETFFLETLRMYCYPPCPKAIIHKLALMHLSQPTYTFERFGPKRDQDVNTDYRFRVHCGPLAYLRHYARRYQSSFAQVRCFYVNCEYAHRIACVYVTNISSNPTLGNLTLLYSHNNGVDLGLCIGYIIRLARRFGASVVSYDYAGFGISGGSLSEEGVYKSIESVYGFLTKTLHVPVDQIVAIGTSLGTAATIDLASKWPLGAVILQGSFMSALRVVCPFRCRISRHDQYENIEKVGKITVPTLFVHGRKDPLFPLKHAKLLRRHCPGANNVEPFYLPKSDHLGFEDDMNYWFRLHDFLHREVVPLPADSLCCTQRVTEVLLIREREMAQAGVPGTLKNLVGALQVCDECVDVGLDQEELTAKSNHSSRTLPYVSRDMQL